MTCQNATLEFTGEIVTPAGGDGTICGGSANRSLVLGFDPIQRAYGGVFSADQCIEAATPGEWTALALTRNLRILELLAVTPASSPMVEFELLFGAPPEVVGGDVEFPSGFTGGEQLVLSFVDDGAAPVVVTVTFEAGDQTAVAVGRRIQAALVLAGRTETVVVAPGATAGTQSVSIGGGAQPGAGYSIEVTTGQAAIGLTPELARGTGDPVPVAGNLLMEVTVPGTDVWVRGGPSAVKVVVAGLV
jgi:hypothetical protein